MARPEATYVIPLCYFAFCKPVPLVFLVGQSSLRATQFAGRRRLLCAGPTPAVRLPHLFGARVPYRSSAAHCLGGRAEHREGGLRTGPISKGNAALYPAPVSVGQRRWGFSTRRGTSAGEGAWLACFKPVRPRPLKDVGGRPTYRPVPCASVACTTSKEASRQKEAQRRRDCARGRGDICQPLLNFGWDFYGTPPPPPPLWDEGLNFRLPLSCAARIHSLLPEFLVSISNYRGMTVIGLTGWWSSPPFGLKLGAGRNKRRKQQPLASK